MIIIKTSNSFHYTRQHARSFKKWRNAKNTVCRMPGPNDCYPFITIMYNLVSFSSESMPEGELPHSLLSALCNQNNSERLQQLMDMNKSTRIWQPYQPWDHKSASTLHGFVSYAFELQVSTFEILMTQWLVYWNYSVKMLLFQIDLETVTVVTELLNQVWCYTNIIPQLL